MSALSIDGVRIGVTDMEDACAAYTLLLGEPPARRPEGVWRFQLGRGAVELAPGEPGLQALCFVADDADDGPLPPALHGVPLRVVRPAALSSSAANAPVQAIDHVVVQTLDPERTIAFWRDRVGLRLALDRTFPERGLRLLFFRSGGITLEYAHALDGSDASSDDRVYGVSY